MDIAESFNEGVVEPSYKKPTWADANRADHNRRKRGEATLSWILPDKGEIPGKRKEQHVDIQTG